MGGDIFCSSKDQFQKQFFFFIYCILYSFFCISCLFLYLFLYFVYVYVANYVYVIGHTTCPSYILGITSGPASRVVADGRIVTSYSSVGHEGASYKCAQLVIEIRSCKPPSLERVVFIDVDGVLHGLYGDDMFTPPCMGRLYEGCFIRLIIISNNV